MRTANPIRALSSCLSTRDWRETRTNDDSSALPLLRLRPGPRRVGVLGVWLGFCHRKETVTDTEEPQYCTMCRAPWVRGNDFCVQCGYFLPRELARALPYCCDGNATHRKNMSALQGGHLGACGSVASKVAAWPWYLASRGFCCGRRNRCVLRGAFGRPKSHHYLIGR